MTILADMSALTGGSDNLVFTATGTVVISIFAWNSTANPVQVKLGIVRNGQSLGAGSWFDGPMLDGLCPLSREGIPLNSGDLVYIHPSATGINGGVVGLP